LFSFVENKESSEDENNIKKLIPDWIELGAKLIGGCCRVDSNDLLKFNEIIINYNK
jgi:S-methylmethionine-dependent homocysteine/selenocysteine methylase